MGNCIVKECDLELEILSQENRVNAKDLEKIMNHVDADSNHATKRHLLVDVRSEQEFRMCRIDGAVNHPIDELSKEGSFKRLLEDIRGSDNRVTFICRRGNDSQVVAKRVLDVIEKNSNIKDLIGGLHEWSKQVDDQFPIY